MVHAQKYSLKLREMVNSWRTTQRFSSERLRHDLSIQYGEGGARPRHQLSFLVEWRLFYHHSNLMVHAQKYSLKLNEILNS
jgi:hypothetical protein